MAERPLHPRHAAMTQEQRDELFGQMARVNGHIEKIQQAAYDAYKDIESSFVGVDWKTQESQKVLQKFSFMLHAIQELVEDNCYIL
jgi:hypothetical protein